MAREESVSFFASMFQWQIDGANIQADYYLTHTFIHYDYVLIITVYTLSHILRSLKVYILTKHDYPILETKQKSSYTMQTLHQLCSM